MFTPEIFRTVFDGTIAACVAYMTQDYIRFRFSPPYPSKEKCLETHEALDKASEARDQGLVDFRNRIENRIDRLEGLILVAMGKRGSEHGNLFDGSDRMDASGQA